MLLVEQNSFLMNSSSIPKERRYSVKSFLGSVMLVILPNWPRATWKVNNVYLIVIYFHFVDNCGLKLGANGCHKIPTFLGQQVVSVCVRLTGFKLSH